MIGKRLSRDDYAEWDRKYARDEKARHGGVGCPACRDSALCNIFVSVIMFGVVLPLIFVKVFELKDPSASLLLGVTFLLAASIGGALVPGALHKAQSHADEIGSHYHK